ncbi:MAG: hypothetical protein AUJ57_06475 [Zetaproteobacteria bacterium CG1_02_53_45]|nr:MAG: hypothetical protein AUJ57_06475 [Zetaproteobacteria bacterium CG1_02_53_45]
MPNYLHPGVYVEEIPSGSKPIEGVGTSITAFVGKGGGSSAAEPLLIHSWSDYEREYGAVDSDDDAMGLAVTNYYLNGGRDAYICLLASDADAAGYQSCFDGPLRKIQDISIIVLPGVVWDSSDEQTKLGHAISHCSTMKNRMVLVDLPNDALSSASDVEALALTSSAYAASYYPWIKVSSPETENSTVSVPPSSCAAGMWSKIDGKRGVWKAPAGMETGLTGVAGLEQIVDNADQDQLNPKGINCIRSMPGAGPVLWGARTLATTAQPEWKYIPVRRTAMMIEQSIYNGIQWAVFEPNKHTLWASLRANISSFMNGLFRAGAFQGEKASDAYFVRCGLGDTMTQGDIDAGQVIVVVGFAPLKPAEFVIVRIQQKVNQQ